MDHGGRLPHQFSCEIHIRRGLAQEPTLHQGGGTFFKHLSYKLMYGRDN